MTSLSRKLRKKLLDLANGEFDLLIALRPEHISYCSGFKSMMHDTDRHHRMAVAFSADSAALVCPRSDLGPALEAIEPDLQFHLYGRFIFRGITRPEPTRRESLSPDWATALSNAVGGLGLSNPRIGVDLSEPSLSLEAVQHALRGFHLADASNLFLQARATKLPEEIELLARAAKIAESAIHDSLSALRPGNTEWHLASLIAARMTEAGALPGFIVATSGPRSALADAYPSSRSIAQGDLIRLDIGCSVDGYWADTARTAVIGQPSNRIRDLFSVLRDGQIAAMSAIEPGIAAEEVFRIAIEHIRSNGVPDYERHHVGHGIGRECFEYPRLAPGVHAVLSSGMVLCVETPYYELGWGGMMTEDTVVITENGTTRLTTSSSELIVLS
ncbi:MAG TPA: Xaa-Pro peptidase family protein [Dongiaceae bacterium]|jgi:Xaa-Pro aminopeptidase|nr:Xaa-Pro peptidase family protein [Dongiaceae bacterium]